MALPLINHLKCFLFRPCIFNGPIACKPFPKYNFILIPICPFNQTNNQIYYLTIGQKQRLCIARAISLNPKLIICDEAVSALDISTQNTIIKLLNKLKKQLKLSYLFITHDLSVARLIADRILVLKKGEIVELNTAEKIFKSPKNSYTKKLISALDF